MNGFVTITIFIQSQSGILRRSTLRDEDTEGVGAGSEKAPKPLPYEMTTQDKLVMLISFPFSSLFSKYLRFL